MKILGSIALLCVVVGMAAGCGDDSPTPPGATVRTIDFPGDAPTLKAAIGMASAGDTVRVGPGAHSIDSTLVFDSAKDGVALIGRGDAEIGKALVERPILDFTRTPRADGIIVAAGASSVTIRGLEITGILEAGVGLLGPGGRLVDCVVRRAATDAVACTQATSDGTIEKNLLLYPGRFGVYCVLGAHPRVVGNTIVGAIECGIYSANSGPICDRNIVVLAQNYGFICYGPTLPTLYCNDAFGNGINYEGCMEDTTTNFKLDPLFCDSTAFTLRSDSPFDSANAGACGQIGAAGVGCAAGAAE